MTAKGRADFFGNRGKDKAGDRARSIKDTVGLFDLAKWRGLNPRRESLVNGSCVFADCPSCKSAASLAFAKTGRSYACQTEGCGLSGDVIALEMAVSGVDFVGACDTLERQFVSGARDESTQDLFAGGAS